jgi:hypothetical protein
VLPILVGRGGARLEALEAITRRRFFLVPANGNGHVHLDHFEVVRQGKLETLLPTTPVAEGAEVEVKLVEVGLNDPTAGVAKLDGDYEVVVAGASKLVGKKVTASVGRALAGAAYATLADGGKELATPITFEAEAEKPVRASRSKKEPASVAAIGEPEEQAEPLEPEVPEAEELEGAAEESDASTDTQPKKKRTRRGTRGGRARKKPAAAASDDAGQESGDESVNGRPAPRIHVPPAYLEVASTDEVVEAPAETAEETTELEAVGADGQPKKKRSRRGSRGGRKRRKPAANGGEEAPSSEEAGDAEALADTPPEYVPMSEWIEDFDSAKRS